MESNKNTPLLEVEHLSIGFEQYKSSFKKHVIQPIKDISITVNKGEVVAIVGASGSGKSLLAHSIMGILPNNAIEKGVIRCNGEELTQNKKEILRKTDISLIPQSVNHLDPLMKVGNQVRSVVSDGDPKLKQRLAFDRYKLDSNVDNLYPFQLSGGMARRVLISTSVVKSPKLIIADEPTPGLSPDLVEETLKNLREFADYGCGVLIITHDIDAAIRVADRIAVFLEGSVIDTVEKEDFSGSGENLGNPYTKKLWQSLPQNKFVEACDIITHENKEDVLEGKGITFGYSKNDKIIEDFNITIKSGEIVGLKGTSGRGKTTIGKILSGYLKPEKGAVTFNGEEWKKEIYNPVQLIYQHPEKAVNPRWKLKNTLIEAFDSDKKVLDALGIKDEWLERYPHELSGGELQRFCIARILNKKTRILIADEMTTMLDAIMQAKVWEIILEYVKEHNMGLLVISHENSIIEKLCDRVIEI